MPVFLETSFELEFGTFARFEQAFSEVIPALTGDGSRLVGAFRHITGNISLARHIWEVPESGFRPATPETAVAAHPEIRDGISQILDIIREQRVSVLTPLPDHPVAMGHGPEANAPVFQRILFNLEFGGMERFEEGMRHLIPALSAQGWSLVGSFRSSTGDLHSAMNYWALPDLESFRTAGGRARAATPGLAGAVAKLIEAIRWETVDLLAPLSYHPSTPRVS